MLIPGHRSCRQGIWNILSQRGQECRCKNTQNPDGLRPVQVYGHFRSAVAVSTNSTNGLAGISFAS